MQHQNIYTKAKKRLYGNERFLFFCDSEKASCASLSSTTSIIGNIDLKFF